jgi:seryl-tRNA synthetase
MKKVAEQKVEEKVVALEAEVTIKTPEDLELALAPARKAANDARDKVKALEKNRQDLLRELEEVGAQRTSLVKSNIGSPGSVKINEIMNLKMREAAIDELVSELDAAVSMAQNELNLAREMLARVFQDAMIPMKKAEQEKISAMFQAIDDEMHAWVVFVDSRVFEFGLSNLVEWYVLQDLYRIVLMKDFTRLEQAAHRF